MLGELVPRDSVTEAFAWLSTAVAVGAAAGAAASGALVDHVGTGAAFGLAGAAGAVAVTVLLARIATLPGSRRARTRLTFRASAALNR